jgi:integrase
MPASRTGIAIFQWTCQEQYRTKKDVQPLLDEKLAQLNAERKSPEARKNAAAQTLTVVSYWKDYFWPFAQRELKPSTSHGYASLWKMYLGPRLATTIMGDFRCVTATQLLALIHQEHRLGRATLAHIKGLLSVVFMHAKRAGVLDGENPVKDAGIPRAAAASKPTHAYSPDEVLAMLDALTGVARTAVALMYFCGLRPGEARAARWENYDGKTLKIRASMWRKHLTDPKTAESAAVQVVPEILADILAESRRDDGFILTSPLGKPVDLYNLTSRVIVPALARCGNCKKEKQNHKTVDHEFQPLPKWRGFYALRRGLATLATSVDSQMGAKSLLRHSNVATTQTYYIKSVPEDAVRAASKIDALFQKSENAVPN